MISLLWKLVPAVRPRERSRFLFFLFLDLLISMAQTLGLVAIESLILSHYGSQALPLNFVAASVVTVLGSLVYALGVHRSKNDRYFIYLHLIFAVIILLQAWLARSHSWAFLTLGCTYYLSVSVLNNHYWTFTGDFFDTLSSKRLFPMFIIGNSIGGFLGGMLVTVGSGWLSTEMLLPLWAIMMLFTALLLRLSRRSLRRWGPLELEEADETSLDGIRNSLLYLRQSSLGRWMVAACIALITAEFISQYLYSQVFSQAYPDSDQLAGFIGRLLALTNLLEILIEAWITPLLIRHLGVATANLLHPITTMLSFVLMAFSFKVPAAVGARINRETLDNAMGQPVRNLVYNALPDRFRGRLRAFLEGIVVYSGMAMAGLFLLLCVDHISPHVLAFCGLAASVVYLLAHFQVRAAYLKTLVAELQAGRLELGELGDELATFEVHRLGQLWEALTGEAGSHPNPVAVRFARTLAARKVFEPLRRTAAPGHQIWLRCTCLRALGKEASSQIVDLAALGDEPELRLAALEVIQSSSPGEPGQQHVWLEQLSHDPDARVRALALSIRITQLSPGQDRGRCLASLLAQAREAEHSRAIPALHLLPPEAVDCLVERSTDRRSDIRATCVGRLGELQAVSHRELFLRALEDSEPSVKVAALQGLGRDAERSPTSLDGVGRLLRDASGEVRSGAAQLLARQGEQVLPLLSSYLTSQDIKTVGAALQALSLMANPRAREQMASQLRQRTHEIWYLNLAILIMRNAQGHNDFLLQALTDAARRDLKLAFEILAHIEDPKVMRSVEKVLRFANLRARADALEVLSNLGDREASHLLVLLLEDSAWEERTNQLPPTLRKPSKSEDVLSYCAESQDRWLRLAASTISEQGGSEVVTPKKDGLMERLLVLRKVPLFAQMSLDQLEAINQLLKEVQYLKGEVIFEQGALGDELYILVEGSVRIVQGLGGSEEVELNRMEGISYFGEMSILDDEPRSASVVAEHDSRLLVLKGDQLKELVHQMPEISFEIFKVLTARIRTTNVRVAGQALKSGQLKA